MALMIKGAALCIKTSFSCPTMSLEGRTALITGAGRGIGKIIAETLSRNGANVVLAARTASQIEKAAEAINQEGGSALAVTTDVTSKDNVKQLYKAAKERFGKVDLLVNNAGSSYVASIVLGKDDKWWDVVNTNLRSCYLCTKACLPGMIKDGFGRVINISSISGQMGAAFNSSYAASKAAVDGLTRSVALEVAKNGVTVNAICPGYVRTELAQYTMGARGRMFGLTADEYLDRLEHDVPRKHLVTAEEIAAAVIFLAGPGASAITGQTLNVCGGMARG